MHYSGNAQCICICMTECLLTGNSLISTMVYMETATSLTVGGMTQNPSDGHIMLDVDMVSCFSS